MAEDLVLKWDEEPQLVLKDVEPVFLGGDTAYPSVVLHGYKFHMPNGEQKTGTYIPLDTSDANATADKILSGYSGYVDGEKIEGTYTLAAATQGTATAAQIKKTYTAWVNGSRVTGTFDPYATLSKKSSVSALELTVPNGTYSAMSTVAVPFTRVKKNCYINSVSSISSMVVKNDNTGATVAIGGNWSATSTGFRFTPINALTVNSGNPYTMIVYASGDFITATMH